jgi:hypothetical protein
VGETTLASLLQRRRQRTAKEKKKKRRGPNGQSVTEPQKTQNKWPKKFMEEFETSFPKCKG